MGNEQFNGMGLELNYEKQKDELNKIIKTHDVTSYKGELSEKDEINNSFVSNTTRIGSENSSENQETLSKPENNTKAVKNNQNLVLYKFEWREGGNQVYLVGTFTTWNIRNLMERHDDIFTVKLVFKIYKFSLFQ